MQDNENSPAKKPSQPCQACRSRHRKCDWDQDECRQCRSASIKCVRQASLKFRFHPKQKVLSRASSKLWRPCPLPRGPTEFYDETPELRDMYRDETPVLSEHERTHRLSLPRRSLSRSISAGIAAGDSVTDSDVASQPNEDTIFLDHLPDDASTLTNLAEEGSSLIENLDYDTMSLSPVEALLIRNFTDHMAQWTDIADPFRTFETRVSQLAFTDLIIRYAICAFSARHFHQCRGDEDGGSQALDYQNRCLNLLIPSMTGDYQITENLLTAVALLRQNEEMDEDDHRFHLEGISRILNMIPEYSTMGGVAEAACWLCLREDIYVSLTTQTPIKTVLDCFPKSASILRNDDYSWASQSILNLALLLQSAFCKPRNVSDMAHAEAQISKWEVSKPTSYKPIYFKARSREKDSCFPEVWMLLPHHVVGLQYYHIAQIVLSAIGPQEIIHTHKSLADSRATARKIRHHLFLVLGLATSNERAENTWFTARHCLAVWGAYLYHPTDQAAVLDFLERWRQRSGWETSALVESLQRQWSENDNND